MINVLYEDNHLLCVEKPVNMPVQADSSHDPDLLTACKAYIKVHYAKPGNVYLGLVHRLDRPVGGAMVFARTDKAASRLSETIRTHRMRKTYLAVLEHIPPAAGTLVDDLIKDPRTNMVRVAENGGGKPARLTYETLGVHEGRALVLIHLETGRSHQIRVQFSSRGWPLVYDQRYNPEAGHGQIALWSYELTFPHPTLPKEITVRSLPPDAAPWTEFEVIQNVRCQKEKEEAQTL